MRVELRRRPRGRRSRLGLIAALTASLGLGSLVAPGAASAVVGVPTSFLDHAYGSMLPPSADKPQSKLWYLDGSWWALMVGAGSTSVFIHELMSDHTWRNTGVLVDNRANSTGDALWSTTDSRLYVASRASGSNLQVDTFSYDQAARTWAVTTTAIVNSGGGSESATLDQDSLGRLWVTYTRASRVWVAHSLDDRVTWTAGFQPAVNDTVIQADDLSALIAFGTSVGVLYSDQQSGGFHFAIHDDGDPDNVWRVENVNQFPNMADDHISLKQLTGDSQGRIFAAIKTSTGDVAGAPQTDPLVGVLTRTPGANGGVGTWAFAPAGTVADDHTRPIIMIDATNQLLYFFATAPVQGGDIFYKTAPLSNVDFSSQPGRGRPFVDATPLVNNASGAKDPVTSTTGLVILAVAHGQKRYVHAEMELPGPGGGDQTAPTATTAPANGATGVPVGSTVTATFSEPVQGVSGTTFTLRDANGTPVPAVVNPDTGNQWVLDPNASLAAGATYTATLIGGATGIRDAAGNSLTPDPTTWSFTTAAAPGGGTGAPTATLTTPADGATSVARGTNVVVTFNEAVQGVDATTFSVTSPTGQAVAGVFSNNAARTRWTFNPTTDLASDTLYTVTLTSGIRDTGGTAMVGTEFRFLTGPAPRVNGRTPEVNATGVSRTANVTATFNEPVQNVGDATFTLTGPNGAAVAATVSRNGTSNQWVLDPVATLAGSTTYTATITGGASGVRDLAGNPLAATVTWGFTTRA